jgi:adenosylhomocysteine nucleosidase
MIPLPKLKHFLSIALLVIIPFSGAFAESYIAVAAAYEPEVLAFKQAFASDKAKISEKKIHGITFETIDYKGKKLLFFPTGMSLTNAAMSTQIALDNFPISAVLFAGIAGGINPNLLPGDVTIPAKWIYHGEAAYFNPKAGGEGYEVAPYFKPKYPNFGSQFPDDVYVIRPGMKKPLQKATFEADPKLLAVAKKALKKAPPLMVGSRRAVLKIGGPGVSGTVFMDNAKYREWVWKTWKADCLDMESTALAHVCWVNQKPCLIVRGLSDLAGGQKGLNQIDHFEAISSNNAAVVLRTIIDAL